MVSCLKNWAVESMASRAQHSVLLVLLLMLLESSSQVDLAPPVLSCPESCRCAHPLKANCSSGSWRSFPLGLNPEVRILHMTNNSILKLDNNTFLITHLPYLNEQEVSYNMTTSSTGYLMQEHMAPGQMYSSDELQNVENCDYAMQATPVKECTHVSPYSVSPVLYSNDNAGVAHCPPPIPAMPPKELLSNSPYAVPLGYVREPPAPVRGRAFSTSEEEESRPLMRPHHGGTLPAAS
ncbi:Protein of unknown function, partial [Gryllus bimaculatus]